MRGILTTFFAAAMMLAAITPASGTPVLSDDFNDGQRSLFWGSASLGAGSSVSETGGSLQMNIPDTATGGLSFTTAVGVVYVPNCTLVGDFDVQVDYQLTTIPSGVFFNHGLLGFAATGTAGFGGVARNYYPGIGDSYLLSGGGRVPTADVSGKLRLQRIGATAQGYYDVGGVWTDISAPVAYSTEPVRLLLAMTESLDTVQNMQGSFDNFVVNQGTLSCPVNQLCGDGTVQPDLGETCEDGNEIVGDGCCACRAEPLPSAPDVAGEWQLNVTCADGGAAWVRPLTLTQTPGTGAATVAATACGTFASDGQVREVATCNSGPYPAQVCGDVFAYHPSDETTFSPLASASGSCGTLARITSESRFNGTITADGTNRAVQIAGVQDLRSVDLFNLGALDPCATAAGNFCTFEMRRNVATAANPTIEPLAGVTISFEQVTQDTVVVVTPETTAAATVPPNFQVLGVGSTPLYFDISTLSGGFTGAIQVCLPYVDSELNFQVDRLQIGHEEGGTFVDKTIRPIDTVNKRVCASVTGFSQFMLFVNTQCGNGHLDAGEQCDDGNLSNGDCCTSVCTHTIPLEFTCSPALATKASLALKKDPAEAKNALKWKWTGVDAFNVAELGAPDVTTPLSLCVYDHDGPVLSALAPAGGTCAGTPCWQVDVGKGKVKYTDKDLTPDGLSKIQGKSGLAGKGKLAVQGKGANLSMSALSLTLPVRARLIRSDTPACWEATFSLPGNVKKNDAAQFKAKSD